MYTEAEVDFLSSVDLVSHVELLTMDESYGGGWNVVTPFRPHTPVEWLQDGWNAIRIHFKNNENRPLLIRSEDIRRP